MARHSRGKADQGEPQRSCAVDSDVSDRELLNLFLSLPLRKRKALFSGTTQAAKQVGLCRRTIEYWIDSGKIRAIRVGEKYQVHLPSVIEYLENRGTLG
jgi:excisionase family DNA binding protein